MEAIQVIRMTLGFGDGGMPLLEQMQTHPLALPGPWGGNHAMWIAGHLAVNEAGRARYCVPLVVRGTQ